MLNQIDDNCHPRSSRLPRSFASRVHLPLGDLATKSLNGLYATACNFLVSPASGSNVDEWIAELAT